MKISKLVSELAKRAPLESAEDWDNVGLLLGQSDREVKRALISIDLTSEAVVAARKNKCELIINHHPCIFPKGKGPSRITDGAVLEALESKIAVASFHTNFDKGALEVSEYISRGLELKPIGRFYDDEELVKLAVFVPKTHFEKVREAVAKAQAGSIGNYDSCGFMTEGEGFFRPKSGSDPFIGKTGKLERVSEVKFETVFQKGIQKQVVSAMLGVHPYEEVAYDLYPLLQGPSKKGMVSGLGYGIYGDFLKPKSFPELIRSVKALFGIQGLLATEFARSSQTVKRVGFVAGKGTSFLRSAQKNGCDVFITGEVGFHQALDARRNGMAVLELGHRESEVFFSKVVSSWLKILGVKSFEFNESIQSFK